MQIKDKVVVVSGGASGLGEATVKRLVKKGAKVAILDFNEERGQAVAKEAGGEVLFCKTDVCITESVEAAFNSILEKWGRVDICVLCAGIPGGGRTISKKGMHDLGVFKKVIDVNLIGYFDVLRHAAFYMAKNEPGESGERGVIVNTSSLAAFNSQVGQVAYAASKGAIHTMNFNLARDLSEYGIRSYAIAPGSFDTPMGAGIPQEMKDEMAQSIPFPSRLGDPDEFAFLVEHIVENQYLNGETIRIDGAYRPQPRAFKMGPAKVK